ncbi:MAG: hypothetical protein ABIL00_04495 [candidate division WOR-3 bacterium]
MVKDPTIYQSIFLFRWHGLEKESEFEWHKKAIREFLSAGWKKVKPNEPFPQEEVEEFLERTKKIIFGQEGREDLFMDVRILSTGWQVVNPNQKLELWTRAYDDALRMQIGYCLEGEHSPQIFSLLEKEILDTAGLQNTSSGQHAYIGETYYPVAEIEKCEEEVAKTIASEIMESLHYPEDEINLFSFPWGYLAINLERKEKPVVLYWEEDKNIWLIAELIHKIFPFLFLNRYKFYYAINSCLFLRKDLNDQEKRIRDLGIGELIRVKGPKGETDVKILKKTEARTIEISALRSEYIQNLITLKGYIKEIEIIQEGLEKLLRKKELKDNEEALAKIWLEDVRFTKEQLNTHLHFYWLTKESVDSTLDSLHKITELRDSQWDRYTNLLIGILSSWALLDVFEANLSWELRLILLIPIAYLFHILLLKLRSLLGF